MASLALAFTLAAGWTAATGLVLDADPDRMTSPELPFRRAQTELETAFPQLADNLVILLEADAAGADVRHAAQRLAERLAADPRRFAAVHLPGSGDFYEEHGLWYLEQPQLARAATQLERAGPLLAALAERPSLTTFLGALAHVETRGRGLAGVGAAGLALVDEVGTGVRAFLDRSGAPLAWNEMGGRLFDAEPPRRQLVLVQPARDFTAFGPALDAIRTVRAAGTELAASHGVQVRVTGDLAVLTEEMSAAEGQIVAAAAASLVLVAGLLFASLGARLLLATLVTLIAGLAWTAGFAALAVGHLNVLTMAFAVLYIGLAVDFGVHFAIGYREQLAQNGVSKQALRGTGRRVGSSLVFCALTTAIGFYAFLPTAYIGVGELGLIAGTGMFMSLLATLTLLPALVALGLGERPGPRPTRLDRVLGWLPSLPLRAPRAVVAGALLVAGAAALAVPALRFESDPLDVRDPRVESVRSMRALLADRELAPWTAEVLVRDPAEARRVAAALVALPEVRRVRSVDDLLPEAPERKAPIFARMARALEAPALPDAAGTAASVEPARALHVAIQGLTVAVELRQDLAGPDEGHEPATPAAVDDLLVALDALAVQLEADAPGVDVADLDAWLFGGLPPAVVELRRRLAGEPPTLAELPSAVRDRYVAADGRVRVEAFPAEDLSLPGALERFADAVRRVRPDAAGAVVGTVELARAIVVALREALAAALVVITALLLVLWRSPRDAFFTLCPLLLGALVTAAVAGLVGLHLNFANVIVLPLLLGIGVDSGIHLVHRYRTQRPEDADVLHTGTTLAVLLSTLTSIASFSTLAFASHQGIASLARLLVLGLTMILLANLLVLPALLAWAGRVRTPTAAESEAEGPRAAQA